MRRCLWCLAGFAGEGLTCRACGVELPNRDTSPATLALERAEGFDPLLFERLAGLEAGSFWFRARNRLIVWALDEYFPDARTYLEVGCGTGFVLEAVHRARPELEVTGSELYAAGLSYARARLPGVTLLQMDVRAIPFSDAFDAIGAFDVLEHVDDDARAFEELARALTRGGGLIVTVPQHPKLWSPADEFAHHQRRYTRQALVKRIREAGLEVVHVTSFVSLLLPAMLSARVRARRAQARGSWDPSTSSPLLLAWMR